MEHWLYPQVVGIGGSLFRTPEMQAMMLKKGGAAAAMYQAIVTHRTGKLAAGVHAQPYPAAEGAGVQVISTVHYAAGYEFGVDNDHWRGNGAIRRAAFIDTGPPQHKFQQVLAALAGL